MSRHKLYVDPQKCYFKKATTDAPFLLFIYLFEKKQKKGKNAVLLLYRMTPQRRLQSIGHSDRVASRRRTCCARLPFGILEFVFTFFGLSTVIFSFFFLSVVVVVDGRTLIHTK